MIEQPCVFLDHYFERSAVQYPDAVAIEQGEKLYTYSEAETIANQLAHYLKEKGVTPEEKVAILLPRCAEVYLVMLGILKAGGAYIPLDPEIPAERVNFIMEDSGAKLLVSSGKILERIAGQLRSFPIFDPDNRISLLNGYPATKPEVLNRSGKDLCYIIYTSGTTGNPKGVLLEHRNVVNYIEGARQIYPLDSSFRALQGFSVSFDASVEEIWVPFSAGATLVTGTFDIMRSGDQFASHLNRLNITFLSCAPTLLSMVNEDIPKLKILIFGGEVCTTDLAHRWCKPGRLVFNTYGPTEATVIATYSILNTIDPVTIGKAMPGYDVLLVNEKLEPTGEGEEGEILLGGESIARGYLNRKELTAQKFVETDRYKGVTERYYRTGDIARYAPNGEIIYIGRVDAQVKVRGFRVELAEIEGLLLQFEGIQAAAVSLDTTSQQLAAFVVAGKKKVLNREEIAAGLRSRLPYYMIPSTLDVLDALPMTTSQKIDRARLPSPKTPLGFSSQKEIIPPATEIEKELVDSIARNIHRSNISMDDNFFEDLGGHSLLAALVSSDLRKNPMFENLSVADLYLYPILSDLAQALEQKRPKVGAGAEKQREIHQPSGWSYYSCSFLQGVSMFFIALIFGIEWMGPFFVYSYFYQADYGVVDSLTMMLVMYFATLPAITMLAISLKWLVIGRIKPGRYKLWGGYYFRFWLADKLVNISPISYFTGTPIMNVFLRMLGSKVGKNCYINTSAISAFDLFSIGNNVSICTDSHLKGFTIADGFLYVGRIDLEDDCYVGTRCCLGNNTRMERNSSIEDLTLVPEGKVIPAGENWGGSPAIKLGMNGIQESVPLWSKRNIFYSVSVFLIPLVSMIAYFPGMMVITHFDYSGETWINLLPHIFLVGVLFIVILVLIISLLKWMLLGNIKEGVYRVNSGFYHRKWFFDQLMKLSLQVLGTLYTTLYLQIWFKMLGVKMGKRVEISTVEFISPDLLVTGDECFLADSVSIGASSVRNGYITIAKTYIGNRTFVGNSAVISPDTHLGDDVLVGVLSKVSEKDLPAKDGTSWFGSPAVYLPRRDINREFSAERTYKPTRKLFILRYSIEFFRVTLPAILFLSMASLVSNITSDLQVERDLPELFVLFPFLYLGTALIGMFITVLLKWILIGRYRPANKPLWSGYVWRSELVTGVYENFLVLYFLNMLTGTPFIRFPLWLLGCRIGKKVCINTTQITEFDLVKMGDYSAVNDNCTLQTHLFEDRVMKMSYVDIGKKCSVGGMSVVLYDSKMEDGSILEPLSVLMKSETLPANNIFIGAPAQKR
ncbi:MAG TPA: Pls/PosA family non-ribosomal peptide synthetase [Prolixibacteraceae bacterium]